MSSLEAEIKMFLTQAHIYYKDGTASTSGLDFAIRSTALGEALFWLEVKEKRQAYDVSKWPETGIAQKNLFILDDLSARKILKHAPYSGVIVRDNTTGLYYFFDVATLMLMPKVRVNRILDGGSKGKWMADLRNGKVAPTLDKAFAHIKNYLSSRDEIFRTHAACWGEFYGEEVQTGGTPRTPWHKAIDFGSTR